jgi:hypothetical protein
VIRRFSPPGYDFGTATEYRAMAEECFKWAAKQLEFRDSGIFRSVFERGVGACMDPMMEDAMGQRRGYCIHRR